MRITHYEILQVILGDRFSKLVDKFEIVKQVDLNLKMPVDEQVFDSVFTVDFCAFLFGGGSVFEHSTRMQRKMDLAVVRHAYHLWRDKNYFDISSNLAHRLVDTDLRDVDVFFLKAPYRSMYISVPEGSKLYVPNVSTGLHELRAVYVNLDDFDRPVNLSIPDRNIVLLNVVKHFHMLVCGELKEGGDAIMFFDLVFFEGRVNDSIDENKKILENTSLWPYIVDVFNFVVKTLLYINCSNVSIQKVAGINLEQKLSNLRNVSKKRKLLQRYSKFSTAQHSFLDVVISSSEGIKKESVEGFKFGPKSLERVRPHFKTQRFGVGLEQSKIIWVESYIRGEGAGVFKEKYSYKVY